MEKRIFMNVPNDTWATSVIELYDLKLYVHGRSATGRYFVPDEKYDAVAKYIKMMSSGFRIKGVDPDGSISRYWHHRVLVRYIRSPGVHERLFVPSVLRTLILINEDEAAYYAEEVERRIKQW